MQSIIALDVDDIIISFIPRLIFLYNKDFKDNLKIEQITDWNLLKFVNKK